jgi:hypothetical protein
MKGWLALGLLPALLQAPPRPPRANELTLARLRPGADTLAAAERLYPANLKSPQEVAAGVSVWRDACRGWSLRVEADAAGVIQEITVDSFGEPVPAACRASARLRSATWATGRGLAPGNACARAASLYGPPASRGPSTQGGRELDLLYYEFDWAGTDVPQVMEISCDRKSGRVAQITLAFPSL